MVRFPGLCVCVLIAAVVGAGCSREIAPAPPPGAFYRFDVPSAVKPAEVQPSSDLTLNFANGSAEGWEAGKAGKPCQVKDGRLCLDSEDDDVITTPAGLRIDGHGTDSVQIKMKVSGEDVQKVSLVWRPAGMDWSEKHRVFNIYILHPGELVTYDAQVSGVKAWRHREIDQLRIHTEKKAHIELESIRVVSRKSVFAHDAVGLHEYSIADRVRPCLFAHCPASVEYKNVAIPLRAKFTAGLGIVDGSAPTTFAINLKIGNDSFQLFSQAVPNDSQWQDIEMDLSGYAGKKGDFSLQATCEKPDQVALWSNPVLFQTRDTNKKAAQPLNVLIYVVDALRADHLDVYGYNRKTGPNIARFAEQGVRFEHCYSQDTWTKPSMTSLATGVDMLVHKVEVYGDVAPDALAMLPGVLRDAGYVTGAITENPHTPPDANQRRVYCNLEAPHLRAEIGDHVLKWNQLPDVTYKDASEFLERNRDRSFFLYVHTMEAHDIPVDHPDDHYYYDPPEPFRSMWAPAGNPDPPPMDLYDGGIAYADQNFQRVLDKLKELGLSENTLVIFMGDHGEGFGEHENKFGHAGKPYIELIHIPLIMQLPGVLPAGRVVSENVQLIDVPPTILDFAGLPHFDQFQGWPLRGLIAGQFSQDFNDRPAFTRWAGSLSLIKGTWKLFDDPPWYTNKKMLFDLANDPGETRDVKGENPQKFDELSKELAEHIKRDEALCEKLQVKKDSGLVRKIDQAAEQGLEALGYIGKDKKKDDPKVSPPASNPAKLTDISDGNVLIIVLDALRADHLGCYGYKRPTSPCIDSVASTGLVFDRALSNASFTCMSIASLFSGVLPSKSPTGIGWFPLPNPATDNMGELFSKAGFATGFFTNQPVFWDTHQENESAKGFERGFQESDFIDKEWGKSGSGKLLSQRALEFIKKHAAEKTMMYLHYMDPHAPYAPSPEKYLRVEGGRFGGKVYPNPLDEYTAVRRHIPELIASGFKAGDDRFDDMMMRYDGEIAESDEAVQLLLDGMKDLGLLDKTMVIITADHGEEFLEHGFVDHGYYVYEESLHIPLIMRLPQFIAPGRIPDRVSLIDVLPTLLDVMRIPNTRHDLDGEVLLRRNADAAPGAPAVFVAPQKPIVSEVLLENRPLVRVIADKGFAYMAAQRWLTPAECSHDAANHQEEMKLFKEGKLPLVDPFGPVVHEEFYNLDQDPHEQQPLKESDNEQFARLKKIMQDYTAAGKKIPRSSVTREISPEIQEKIDALGYGDSKKK